jgi:hypothetical protein
MSPSEHTVKTPSEGFADSLAPSRPASRDTLPDGAPRGSEVNIGVPPYLGENRPRSLKTVPSNSYRARSGSERL